MNVMVNWISVEDDFPPEELKVLGLFDGGLNGPEIISVEWSKRRGWVTWDFQSTSPLSISFWTHMIPVPDEWWGK